MVVKWFHRALHPRREIRRFKIRKKRLEFFAQDKYTSGYNIKESFEGLEEDDVHSSRLARGLPL